MKKTLLLIICLTGIFNINSQTIITIGSGNSYSSSNESSPINSWYKSHHCQILYTAAEIMNAGYSGSGAITKLGFNVFSAGSEALPNFNISLKNTSSSDLTVYEGTGLTTVYTNSLYAPTVGGFDLLNLSNSFVWDGTSNLVVDVCFDLLTNYSSYGQVYNYAYTSIGSEYQFAVSDLTSQCGINTLSQNTAFKPQIQLEFPTLPLCTGTPTPGFAVASNTLVCPNTAFSLQLNNNTFSSGLLYQWQSSTNGSAWSNFGTASYSKYLAVNSITDTTYYRCITTCTASAQSNTSTPTVVNLNPLFNCYCTPSFSLNCAGDNITNFSISNILLEPTNCDFNSGYSDSTGSAYTTINLQGGLTYSIQANIANSGNGGNMAAGAWIDFNQNGIFESNEYTSLGYGSTQTYSNQINVPINISSGAVRMRLKVEAYYSGSNTVLDPCDNNNAAYYGQILDYKVNLIAAPLCSGTPTIATAISTETAVCVNVPYTLDLINNDIVTGIDYQWQSSINGTVWTNLGSSQTTTSYSISSQNVTTYYRCITTCIISALSSTSSPVVVNQNIATQCYCEPEIINCNYASFSNVLFETINDNPICDPSGYSLNTTNTITLNANQTYSISTSCLVQGSVNIIGLWIDYNQNGYFDYNEFSQIPAPSAGTSTANISIPFTALGGNTRMRLKIEQIQGTSAYTLEPCTNMGYNGQVLDYLINIIPATPCTGATNAGNATSNASSICENTPFTLNLINNTIASNISYQWQYSLDNTTWVNLGSSQSSVPYTVESQTATTYYRCLTTCSSGTLTATSTTWTVTQNGIMDCHCIPPPSDCSNGTEIIKVVLSTLSNTSTCGIDGYTNYSSTVPSVSLAIAANYSITVKVGADYSNYVSVWIDYNQNGEFDTSEYTQLGSVYGAGDSTIISSITIPTNALLGNTKMRVRSNSSNYFNPDGACTKAGPGDKSIYTVIGNGETEDYKVTITQQSCNTVSTPSNVAVTANDTICYGEAITIKTFDTLYSITGITYQWKVKTVNTYINEGIALNTSSTIVTPTVTSKYYCEVQCNGNFWFNTDTMSVVVKPSTNIFGSVFTNSTTPVAGRAVLYKYLPYFTQFDSVAGQSINASGNYNFVSFHSGIYIVKAIPTATNSQIAYGDTAVNWKTAKQINHGCVVNDIQNIYVKELQTFVPGPGTLTGIITETLGYGSRPFGSSFNNGGEFKPTAPGNPIGGIVVKGGRNPGGQMFTQTITSSTPGSLGTYTLSGLPYGDYFVLVDITGLDTNNTYHVKITPQNNVFNNLDFTVDSIQINPVYDPNVGIQTINAIEHKINVFPNPASNYVTVQYTLQNSAQVKIELYDILGKIVKTLLPLTQQSTDNHKLTWHLDELKSGLYFIKININGSESTTKLSITN